MGTSIEWAHAAEGYTILAGDEEAADGNTPNDGDPGADRIGVCWDGICLYGTRSEVHQALLDAAAAVAARAD